MKKSSQEHKVDGRQELERFKMASARLVQRAEKDQEFARELMRATGYSAVMSKSSPRQKLTAKAIEKPQLATLSVHSATSAKRKPSTSKRKVAATTS